MSTGISKRPEPSAPSAGLRLGLLFGPSIFGVSAAGIALPAARAALEIGPSTAAWILTVHALALGIGTALFGKLLDILGVRHVLLTGSIVLAAGAAPCLLAPGVGTVLAGRFLLAAGSGAMTSSAVTPVTAGEPRRRVVVLAWYGVVVPVLAGGATLVGGAVTTALSWRWTLVLPVLSLVGVGLSLRMAGGPRGATPVDVVGAALLTLTAAAGLVLLQAPSLDLGTGAVYALAVLALGVVGALAWWVRRRPAGFVPPSLLIDRGWLRAGAAGFGVFGGLFAAMYAVPALLVGDRGWTVLGVGAVLLPGAALGAVVARLTGRLSMSGQQLLLVAVTADSAVALGAGGLSGARVPVIVGASLAFAAFAVAQVVLTTQAAATIAPAERGSAMGLLTLVFMVGGAVGSATAGSLAARLGVGGALAVAAVLPLAAAAVAAVGAMSSRRAAS